MTEKLTDQEAALSKRVGKGGRAFVLARRERPGMSLLEYQAGRGDESVEVEVEGTTPAASEAMSRDDLRAAAESRGLDTRGTKAELVGRINEHQASGGSAAGE
jgi:SAP domain